MEPSEILECFDYAEDAIGIVDKDGRYVYVNQSLADIFGQSKQAVVGGSFSEFGRLVQNVKNDGFRLFDVFRTRKKISDVIVNLEPVNGKPMRVVNSMYPIFDRKGELAAVFDIFKSYAQTVRTASNLVGFSADFTFDDILGASAAIKDAVELAKKIALLQDTTLILGESGTGKELFAQSMHNYGSRSAGPFVALNCASLSPELFESELFGYVDGAFTGASKKGKIGKFELADGGTLFLDEIAEMPLALQAKLLRVLETRKLMKIGDNKETEVDVRVMAATNRDLKKMTEEKQFRLDLYYRLLVLNLPIPPLRQRRQDIGLLAGRFLNGDSAGGEWTLSRDAVQRLMAYDWPGNIRELKNLVSRLKMASMGGAISGETVDMHIGGGKRSMNPERLNLLKEEIWEREMELLNEALRLSGGNKKKAADLLGVSRKTLYRRMEKFGGGRREETPGSRP